MPLRPCVGVPQVVAEREAGRQEGAKSVVRDDSDSLARLQRDLKAARAAQADAEGMVARLRRELTTELRRVPNVAEQERTVNQREKSALRAQLEQLRRVTEQRSKLADQERSALEVEVQAAMGASREKEAILQRQVRG